MEKLRDKICKDISIKKVIYFRKSMGHSNDEIEQIILKAFINEAMSIFKLFLENFIVGNLLINFLTIGLKVSFAIITTFLNLNFFKTFS